MNSFHVISNAFCTVLNTQHSTWVS